MNAHTNKAAQAQEIKAAAVKAMGTQSATTVEPSQSTPVPPAAPTPSPALIGELAQAAATVASNSNIEQVAAATERMREEAAKSAATTAIHNQGAKTADQITKAVENVNSKGRFRSFISRHKVISATIGLAVVGGIAYGVKVYMASKGITTDSDVNVEVETPLN